MTLEELKEDYDWQQAFCYSQFTFQDVKNVIALEEGYNDGESWVIVVELNNGTFGYIDAWCDYTGWDCRAGGDSGVYDTLENLQRWGLTTKTRRRLGMILEDLDT
jgi:hypothetical protein